jgi:hypothetical protein
MADVDPTLVYWALCCLKALIQVSDHFLDFLFGYSITKGTREERAKSQNYKNSAQLVTVLARAGHGPITDHKLNNFCWRHDQYVNPRFVLERDNVTMCGFTTTHAYFSVMHDDDDLYNVEERIDQSGN